MDNIKDAKFLTFKNKTGMEVTLTNYGAAIYSISINGDYVTFSPRNKETFLRSDSYYGKTVGPICGRINNGLIITPNEKKQLVCLEPNKVILHSGKIGLSFKLFESNVVENKEFTEIIYSLNYVDDLNEGYFNAYVEISYKIFQYQNKIILSQKVKPVNNCFYSLTNHSYFNMSPTLRVKDEKLRIDSDEVANLDSKLLLNKWDKVNNVFSFKTLHLISEHLAETYPATARGYDHAYKLNKRQPQIVLEGDKYRLSISTDYDGVVVYTNNYNKPDEIILGRKWNKQYDAIAIEPQIEPFNFKKMEIKADKVREYHIEYVFESIGGQL